MTGLSNLLPKLKSWEKCCCLSNQGKKHAKETARQSRKSKVRKTDIDEAVLSLTNIETASVASTAKTDVGSTTKGKLAYLVPILHLIIFNLLWKFNCESSLHSRIPGQRYH